MDSRLRGNDGHLFEAAEFDTPAPARYPCAMSAILILCACPDDACAERIATTLVERRLAACVNRIGGVLSTYRWKGSLQRDSEVLLLIKSTRERYPELRDAIVAAHPYELPEVIAVDIALGLDRYLAWIGAETAPDASAG